MILEDGQYPALTIVMLIQEINPSSKNFAPGSGVPEFEGGVSLEKFSLKNSYWIWVGLAVLVFSGIIFAVKKR